MKIRQRFMAGCATVALLVGASVVLGAAPAQAYAISGYRPTHDSCVAKLSSVRKGLPSSAKVLYAGCRYDGSAGAWFYQVTVKG